MGGIVVHSVKAGGLKNGSSTDRARLHSGLAMGHEIGGEAEDGASTAATDRARLS
jgi:hypothetical protein